MRTGGFGRMARFAGAFPDPTLSAMAFRMYPLKTRFDGKIGHAGQAAERPHGLPGLVGVEDERALPKAERRVLLERGHVAEDAMDT